MLGEFCRCYREQFGVALFNSVRYEIEGAGGPQPQLLHRKVRAPSRTSLSFPEPSTSLSQPAGCSVALCCWSSPAMGICALWGSLGWFLFSPSRVRLALGVCAGCQGWLAAELRDPSVPREP